ncbi:GTP binding domain-containing protein [Artemisia annua]|uniref:GTP binding domain-containing protein n=1 Tax=Artemisia annua TaxID=35608 RepID=A0A2U1MD59_ARTAN|nr:GTP binding domain-containing protein [Artemisia annua]
MIASEAERKRKGKAVDVPRGSATDSEDDAGAEFEYDDRQLDVEIVEPLESFINTNIVGLTLDTHSLRTVAWLELWDHKFACSFDKQNFEDRYPLMKALVTSKRPEDIQRGIEMIQVKEILRLCAAEMLVTLHKIPAFGYIEDNLSKVATLIGKLKRAAFSTMMLLQEPYCRSGIKVCRCRTC